MLHTATDRHHVADTPIFRVLSPEDCIEVGTLDKIGVAHFRIHGKQGPRHFDHVVRAAALGRTPVHHLIELVRLPEVFVLAVAAGRKSVMFGHFVPEELRGLAVGFIAGIDVSLQFAQHFGNVRIGVLAGKNVLSVCKWIHYGAVLELVRELQPAPIAGIGV